MAFLLRLSVEIDLGRVLSEADDFLPGDQPWLLVSAWPMPKLTGEGWHLVGHPPFMVRPVGGEAPPVPTVAADRRGGGRCRAGRLRGRGARGLPRRPRRAGRSPVAGAEFRLFVGYEGERPVAVAAAWLGDGIAESPGWLPCPTGAATARR